MADLVEGHDSLDFVSMVVGDGEYTSEEKNINTLKARTSLKSLKETYAISFGEQTSAVDVRLVSNISNYDPSTGEPLFAEGFYVLSMHDRTITSGMIGYYKALMKCGLIRSKEETLEILIQELDKAESNKKNQIAESEV